MNGPFAAAELIEQVHHAMIKGKKTTETVPVILKSAVSRRREIELDIGNFSIPVRMTGL